MILIADAHVGELSEERFFTMLASLEETTEPIVFLGDVFDLWIALPGYEARRHKRFSDWCRRQKERRTVGLLEGNHEIFVAEERAECFSWCTNRPWKVEPGGLLLCHGDWINWADKPYRIFRNLVRSRPIKTLMRIVPFAPRLAPIIKAKAKKTNRRFRCFLPVEEIRFFAESRFSEGISTIITGHFHMFYRYDGGYREGKTPTPNPSQEGNKKVPSQEGNQKLYILPDWDRTGVYARYDESSGEIRLVSEMKNQNVTRQ
jgi:UDP-2,3-diacylglucosamine hydrolase